MDFILKITVSCVIRKKIIKNMISIEQIMGFKMHTNNLIQSVFKIVKFMKAFFFSFFVPSNPGLPYFVKIYIIIMRVSASFA